MKIPLFLAALVLALFACSCRTNMPIDPMTMKPSVRCLPGHYIHHIHHDTCHIVATK